jgi:hypothetical protein
MVVPTPFASPLFILGLGYLLTDIGVPTVPA